MSKKPAKTDKAKPSPQLEELQEKVDAIMNTAPELSLKLLKTVKSGKVPTPEPSPEPPAEATPEPTDQPEPETPPEEPSTEAAPAPADTSQSIIDDPDTDKAVADIVIREGDTQLAVEDAIAKRKAAEANGQPGSAVSGFWILLLLIIIIGTAAVAYLWFR